MLFVLLKNIYKDPMIDLLTIQNAIHAYLPLSSCPGMTIRSSAMMLRGEGEGGPGVNIIMTLIKKKKFGSVP